MRRGGAGAALVLALASSLVGGLGACDGGGDGDDPAAFCDAVGTLKQDDPFAELQIASPGEMRDAFDELDAGVDRIADSAPGEARTQARSYQESVRELIDQLRGAGFDPRNVDSLDYRLAVADYKAAAISVENAAEAICR